ncbi:hypothetical protein EPO05_02880 [Patescibacteria group bacterium]|nr:MAG: hypothetical protein EPO05_02880 [Patescibacteria group bacterium]
MNPSFWAANDGLGQIDITFWKIPLNYAYGLFAYFGLSSNVSEKFLVMWAFMYLAPIGSFFLVRQILKSDIAAFVGAVVFSFSTYFVAINTRHLTLSVAACFGVIAILFILKAFKTLKMRDVIWADIFIFLSGVYDFRFFYVTMIIVGLYFSWSVIVEMLGGHRIIPLLRLFAWFLLIAALLNIFWLLPFIKAGSITENAGVGRDLVGNNYYLDLAHALTMTHPFWTGGEPEWFNHAPIPISQWLIAIFAFLGIWLGRKNKDILFFGLLATVGIILVKQETEPFSGLYGWLYRTIPGFNAFREASKFYYIIATAYAVLVGMLVFQVTQQKWKVWLRSITVGFILLTCLMPAWPVFSGSIKSIFTPRVGESEFLGLNEMVSKDKDYYRVFFTQTSPLWYAYDNLHPKIEYVKMRQGLWEEFNDSLILDESVDDEDDHRAASFLMQSYSARLLDLSSVKYVVVREQSIRNALEKNERFSGLFKKMDSNRFFTLYENSAHRPHLYSTSQRETIYRDIPFSPVQFQFINSSEYKIELKNIKDPVYLNFSDSFHPDWKLSAGEIHWWQVIFNKQYFLADKNHLENDAKLNSFYLDPKEVCGSRSVGVCKPNVEGGYDMNLTLFFKAQAWVYFGFIISGVTLIGCVIYLIYATIIKTAYQQASTEHESLNH